MKNISIQFLVASLLLSVAVSAHANGLEVGLEKYREMNYSEALSIFKKLESEGVCDAKFYVGLMVFRGHGVKQNTKTGLDKALRAVKCGSTRAMNFLGDTYIFGNRVTRDCDKAIYYYELAHSAGDYSRTRQYSSIYTYGLGTEVDCKKAIEIVKNAVDAGDNNAMFWSAVMHNEGICMRRDGGKALNLARKALNETNPETLYLYGLLLRNVNGEYRSAVKYMIKAADLGYSEAYYEIGATYLSRKVVERDYKRAMFWLLKGAAVNDGYSQYALGQMYEHGAGVTKDIHKAMEYYQQAVDNGVKNADVRLKKLQIEH